MKVGDIVYQTDGVRIYESTITGITTDGGKTIYDTGSIAFDESAIGESVFLTREQAAARLKSWGGNK